MTVLLTPPTNPFELSTPGAAVPSMAAIAAAVAPLLLADATMQPSLITNVTSESQSIGDASFIMIRRNLTAAEVGTAADVPLLNGQTGKVILPLYAWVHIVTGAVAPSSSRTVSIAYTAGGNPLTGSITSSLANQNNYRTFDIAEAALATSAQALGSGLVIRTTSAAVTPNGATTTIWVLALVVTP